MAIQENTPADTADVRSGSEAPVRARRARRLAAREAADVQNVSPLRRPKRGGRLSLAQPSRPDAEVPPNRDNDEEGGTVVSLVERLHADLNSSPARKRNWALISALVAILGPTLLATIYFVFFAADRYVSEARFAVRSNDAQAADVLGMVTGFPSSSGLADSYIVSDYILSREMVSQLESRLPLRQMFADSRADFLTRLDPEVTLEDLTGYWSSRTSVYFDAIKSTIAVKVEAFAAPDAQRILTEMVDIVRILVNDLSAQARRDAVQFASGEVAKAELRVRAARDDLVKFRAKNKDFDPAQTASAAIGIVAQLEGERSQLNSQLAAVASRLAETAPSVQMLKSRISALQEEIDRIQGEISVSGAPQESGKAGFGLAGGGALANVVADYQELQLSQTFAETAYTAALGSLERARAEADRTQSYLAIYLKPNAPDAAAYPQRVWNIFLVFLLAAIVWAIGSLAFLTARDHVT